MRDLEELSSEEVFAAAKDYLAKGDILGFRTCKEILSTRDFMARFHASLGSTAREELVSDMRKAILTKPSEEREAKAKKAKPAPKAKLGLNAKGRTYQYDDAKGGAPAPATEGPPPPKTLNPERLAHLLKTTVGALKKIAESKSEEEFAAYFKSHGRKLIRKHKIPDDYWQQLYAALKPEEFGKSFRVDPTVYAAGTEEREAVEALVKAEVASVDGLTAFVRSTYGLNVLAARDAAREFHKALVEDGAIKEA